MSKMKIKTGIQTLTCILLLLVSITGSLAQAANITVTTSRNPVSLDDSFHLVYEADSSVDDDPDFAPIYQYFDVLSSSQSTNMRSINGNWTLKKSWDLTVIAKEVGKFTIPAIKFGKDISPAIQVTVTSGSSPNSSAQGGQDMVPAKIFLESSIDKKQGWVQSQFIYTVRLLRTVSITGASMTEPVTSDPDVIIQQLNEDKYQTTRNGIRYEVFERRYAIFPQKSGPLKIEPVTFESRIHTTQPRNIFDQFRLSGQLKRLRSKAVEVDVKAAPAAINLQDWLPASNLQLVEEWSEDVSNMKVGEPITRTITIAAEGLTAVQLPDIRFEDIPELKQYPDKAVVENRQSAAGLTGLKQIKVALIPARPGSYTLPEIKIEWWNTKTDRTEFATLPSVVLSVTGPVNQNSYPDTPAVIQQPSPGEAQTDNAQPATADTMSPSTSAVGGSEAHWKWLSLFFAAAWIVTLLLFFKRSNNMNKMAVNKPKTTNNNASLKSATAKVSRYVKDGNAHAIRTALIEWAQLFYQDNSITSLSQISQHCSPQLEHAIRQLDKKLYSPNASTWQADDLIAALKHEKIAASAHSDTQNPALKPLYNK